MTRTKYEHQNRTDINEPGLLWEALSNSRVDRFHPKIVVHEKSVLFGYADVTIVVETANGVLCPVKLRGIVVKSLKGKPHIDMPAEKGGNGEFYDIFMPRSAAFRTVLTTLVFSDAEVQATIASAANAPAESADDAGTSTPAGEQPALSAGNPFANAS